MTNIENPKNPKKFECIHCNYMTSSKKYYEKHLLKRKDKIRTMTKEKSHLEIRMYFSN